MRYMGSAPIGELLGQKILAQLHPGDLLTVDRWWGSRTPLNAINVAATVVDVIHLDGPDVENPVNPVDPDHPERTLRVRVVVGDKKWTIDADPRGRAHPLPKHHQVCGECGEVWPCRDERIDRAAMLMTHELDDQCNHCGERIRGAWSASWTEDGVRRKYHIAKKYRANGRRCFDAYEEAWKAHQDRIASSAEVQ